MPHHTHEGEAVHVGHTHRHGSECGHTAIMHEGHTDYVHNGHLHHPNGSEAEEHRIAVDDRNPAKCTPTHNCGCHEPAHQHGSAECRHEPIPHGDHTDFLVEEHLHHPHGDHCDDHGPIDVIRQPPS